MNVGIGVRRPLGCLKLAVRTARYQRSCRRWQSTEPSHSAQPIDPLKISVTHRSYAKSQKVARFHVWKQVPSVTSKGKYADPLPTLLKNQLAVHDASGARTRMFSKQHSDSAKVGDVLQVSTKTGEPFAGAFLEIRRRGLDTAILLRGQLMKTSVEMWFKIYSPTTTAVDIIWRRPKRARRARLTYMRKPSHDMGSVENLVMAWKKERYALRSKEKARAAKGNKR